MFELSVMKYRYRLMGARSTYVQFSKMVPGYLSKQIMKNSLIKYFKSLILHFHIIDFRFPKVTNPSPHMRDKVFAFEIEIQRKKQKTDSM